MLYIGIVHNELTCSLFLIISALGNGQCDYAYILVCKLVYHCFGGLHSPYQFLQCANSVCFILSIASADGQSVLVILFSQSLVKAFITRQKYSINGRYRHYPAMQRYVCAEIRDINSDASRSFPRKSLTKTTIV